MQIFTYLSFTLLSVFILFSVIDFIQGRLKLDEKPVEPQRVSQKRHLKDVLNDVSFKPHALYFRTQKYKDSKSNTHAKFINNVTLTELLATTDLTTTVFDVLYDENTTITDESFTTESYYTTTDIDNVTEISLFEKINETTTKTDSALKKTATMDCSCNLLVKVCDFNCCCDRDCLDSETNLFPNCAENKSSIKENEYEEYCLPQLSFISYGNGLFCIVKVNLPEEKNLVVKKTEPEPNHNYLTWKSDGISQNLYEFSNSMYKYGDPIWLYKNGTIYHADVPVPTVNNYCSGRKALQFLNDEKFKCIVKIGDLEMLQLMKSLEEVTVISATALSINSSVLNCSTLHCVNWTIIACKNLVCTNYTESLHEPTCTETICSNLALKIDYIFYYYDFKIVNATIKLHLETKSMSLPFMSQEIQVKFVVGNESIDRIIKLSGNPGYLNGLPIIVSYAEINHTDAFYNSTLRSRHLVVHENKEGFCTFINSSENFVLFGRNRRMNCRYNHKSVKTGNATEQCKSIQNNINSLLELNKLIFVSPLGNPQQLKDEEWLFIEKSFYNGTLYGKVQERSAKLVCFNLVSRYSMVFKYVKINGNNRILSGSYATIAKNTTFNLDDISSVITIDINFIDITRPSVFEYSTGHPSVNLHLPNDLFYPFRSNQSRVLNNNVFTMILYFITYFLQIK